MSKLKLQAARELIQEKQYQAARAVLETMPDDSTALKWLMKLDEVAPSSMPQKTAKSRRSWLPLLTLILGLVLGILLGRAGLLQQVINRPSSSTTPAPTITTILIPTKGITETEEVPIPTLESAPPTTTSAVPAPLTFEGAENTMINSVEIPAGSYRAIVTTNGPIEVNINPTEGECGAGNSFLTPVLFSLSPGQASDGAEAVFTSRNCIAVIVISNVEGNWTLKFEEVG